MFDSPHVEIAALRLHVCIVLVTSFVFLELSNLTTNTSVSKLIYSTFYFVNF